MTCHHHIWLQHHIAAVEGVLFARAALVVHLIANDFNNNAGRMKYPIIFDITIVFPAPELVYTDIYMVGVPYF